MQRNVVLAASARLAASLFVLLAGTGTGIAGDAAKLDVIGFSPDGRYFAFEEFGVQDGSGFPYSNIYVVDLETDEWTARSPYRVRLESDGADVEEARQQSQHAARAAIERLAIKVPAESWSNEPPLGDGDKAMAFSDISSLLQTEGNYFSLKLTTRPAASPLKCETYMGTSAVGFTLRYARDEGVGSVVHADTGVLPRSRGCPVDYRIHALIHTAGGEGPYVAIIASYPFGFEGPDRRFLAVPLGR